MTTDDDSQPLEGEIVGPEGDGEWLSVPDAFRRTGIPMKTLYRRVEHNRIPSRKNADGRIEVWIAGLSTTDSGSQVPEQRLSPIVGVDMAQVSELLAPLAQALADSQREALTATDRAARAEKALETANDEIRELRARLSQSRTERLGGIRGWLRKWLLLEGGDSQ
jgi:hypothetical protein